MLKCIYSIYVKGGSSREWNRMLEGNVKRVMDFLLGLYTFQEGTRRTIEGVNEFLKKVWAVHTG